LFTFLYSYLKVFSKVFGFLRDCLNRQNTLTGDNGYVLPALMFHGLHGTRMLVEQGDTLLDLPS
jgi:hypothetical protein